MINIDKIHPNPWNPNVQTDFMYQKTRASIIKLGFVDPLTVRQVGKEYEIIDGEHRWKVIAELKENGMADEEREYFETNANKEELQKTIDTGNIPCTDLGEIPDHVARQLTIVLNNTRGETDNIKLAEMVTEMLEMPGVELQELEFTLPYTGVELDDLSNLLSFDPDQYGAGGDDETQEDDWKTYTFTVHKDNSPIIDSEFDRVGDDIECDKKTKSAVRNGLVLKAICLNSAQVTP